MADKGQATGISLLYIKEMKNLRTKENKESGSRRAVVPAAPSLEDIKEYAAEIGSVSDPEEFYKRYARQHWKANGTRIRDWKALYDAWDQIDRKRGPAQQSSPRPEYFDRIQYAIDHENDMDPAERKMLEDDIHLAQEALRNCSTLDEAARYYHERTKL